MEETHLLLFSGGVDSIVALKTLIDKGITPDLLFFKTKKLSHRHERMIRRNAKRLSPESHFYMVKTETFDYHACEFEFDLFDDKREFYGVKTRKDESDGKFFHIFPCKYATHVYLGTFLRDHVTQEKLKKAAEFIGVNLKFPVWDIEPFEEWKKLPSEIKKDTVSSTRDFVGTKDFTEGLGEFVNSPYMTYDDGRKK